MIAVADIHRKPNRCLRIAPLIAAGLSSLLASFVGCAPLAGSPAAEVDVAKACSNVVESEASPLGVTFGDLNLDFEDGSKGWTLRQGEVDEGLVHNGRHSIHLRRAGRDDGFALVRQDVPIERVRGRRLRYRGWLRASDISGGFAGLWLRVDKGASQVFFDNMQERGLTRQTPWRLFEIVTDVPADATKVAFGALLAGSGSAWVDDLSFRLEEAGASIPISGVVSHADGTPSSGVRVLAVHKKKGEVASAARSDDKGRFELSVPLGEYALTAASASQAGFVPSRLWTRPSEVELKLGQDGGFVASGRVFDADGEPVAADIECHKDAMDRGMLFRFSSGASGDYRIQLPNAGYRCHATKEAMRSSFAEIAPDDQKADGQRERDFRLRRIEPAPRAVVDWIRASATPLLTAQAGHGARDLLPIRRALADVRVVGLGEATHGSREFFQMKHRMLEFMVEHLGFSVFAIEANWPESEAVNDYVLTGKGSAAEALSGLHFWTWDTEEVLDLIEWMRAWNLDPRHTKKVKFYGVDMQFTKDAAARLLQFLERVDPGEAARHRESLHAFHSSQPAGNQAEYAARNTALKAIAASLQTNRSAYRSRSDARDWLLARQCLRILEQHSALNDPQGSHHEVRDRSMADNIQWIVNDAEPGAKVVLWAHNGHITMAEHRTPRLGRHLADALGPRYLPVGFAFQRGGFQAIDFTGEGSGVQAFAVGAAPVGSVGDTLSRAGWPQFFLDLRDLPRAGAVREWFAATHATREIGSVFSSEASMREDVVLTDHYGALIFIEATTRARPNKSGN